MRFSYLEPKTIEEAVSLLKEHGCKASVMAGGTDLLVKIRSKTVRPEYVVDIGYIPGLDYIKYDEKHGLSIGTLTLISTIEKSAELQQRFPVLAQAAGQLGSLSIRNMGTIGGNLCNAAPSAETAPALIVLSAKAKIVGPHGEREVHLENFFTGPGSTVLGEGDILVEIQVPVPKPNTRAMYLKHGARGTIDLAMMGVAVAITFEAGGEVCSDIKIALGAVAPTPMRAYTAEQLLRGKKIDDNLIEQSAEAAAEESRPITDVRAPMDYRREMVKVFTRRAIRSLVTN
jgi:carbon-monoxide dehydrogenase medium subunit